MNLIQPYNGTLKMRIIDFKFEQHWQHPQDFILRLMNGNQIADLIPDIIMKETVWMELINDSLEVLITNRHANSPEIGYAQVKLSQMLRYPDTQHKIHVHLAIRDRERGWIEREAGTIIIELFFSTKPINGVLTLLILNAQLSRDTEVVSKMDPYVILNYGGKQYKTKVLNQAGKTPQWNQTFQFPISRFNQQMQLIVMDSDMTKDDEVGRTRFGIRNLGLINRQTNDRTLELVYAKSKDQFIPAGIIRIRSQFNF